jgi:hypothetical protein
MQDHRPIAESLLMREQQSARQLGVSGMSTYGENRPRRGGLRAHFRTGATQNGETERDERRAHHAVVDSVFAALAAWLRHLTQMIGAPNDT